VEDVGRLSRWLDKGSDDAMDWWRRTERAIEAAVAFSGQAEAVAA